MFVLVATALALIVATTLALVWPGTVLNDIDVEGSACQPPWSLMVFVYIDMMLLWVAQDCSKVATYRMMECWNVFDYNMTALKSTRKQVISRVMTEIVKLPHGTDVSPQQCDADVIPTVNASRVSLPPLKT